MCKNAPSPGGPFCLPPSPVPADAVPCSPLLGSVSRRTAWPRRERRLWEGIQSRRLKGQRQFIRVHGDFLSEGPKSPYFPLRQLDSGIQR